ncbi:MAG: DUF5658 family protein [Chloroherpetonaceae bacterium]|nr:DUF5658 family protein [Chthonomonadaceae bacterium]MDW8206796.1 DUF5658 family protein [Chloroherpetonaceae bacterium]
MRHLTFHRVSSRVSPEGATLALLCLLDLVVTVGLIHTGIAVEGNPVLGFYLQRGMGAFIASKLLLSLGPILVLEWLRGRRPCFIRHLLRASILLYLLVYFGGVLLLNPLA